MALVETYIMADKYVFESAKQDRYEGMEGEGGRKIVIERRLGRVSVRSQWLDDWKMY